MVRAPYDTPGHESFTNLRSRGSSLCDLAILVVDIMHGLEPQTLESLNMLRMRKTPFIIALNKIDRMYDWKSNDNFPTRETLDLQASHAKAEFEDRAKKVMLEFANEGLNAAIYWNNPDVRKFINVVPTSAITGEGIPDLIHTLVDLTQTRMNERRGEPPSHTHAPHVLVSAALTHMLIFIFHPSKA